MSSIKNFSELLDDERRSSSVKSEVNIHGTRFRVEDGGLLMNDFELMEEDLSNLADILSRVVIYKGIDQIIETLQSRIDDLFNSNINENDRVIPLQDINIMLDYASGEYGYPIYMDCTPDQLDHIRNYIVSHLEFYGIHTINHHCDHRNYGGITSISDYLAIPECFWYTPWTTYGSLKDANRSLSKVQSSILKYYNPTHRITEYVPIVLTEDGFKVTGDPIKSATPPEGSIVWNSESDARSYQMEIIKLRGPLDSLMDQYGMKSITEVTSNLIQLAKSISNDASTLTFNGNSIGVSSAFKLMEVAKSLHPDFVKLINGKLTGYIANTSAPANPVTYKYSMESNWGSSIASRLFNSLGKICYRWHNDGDDPLDFASYPSFKFMIGVDKFLDDLSLKNRIMFNWGILKVHSTLKSDPNLNYSGIHKSRSDQDDIDDFLEFVEKLMDSESRGDTVDWSIEFSKFNRDHQSSYFDMTYLLEEDAPVEIAYNLCGAMWEITKRYPNFLNDGSEDNNDIDPDEF